MPRKCGRRSRLYARELAQTADYLRDLLGDPPFSRTDAQRLAPALADKALVDALEDILVPYAVYGVARDLARLKKSRVLFLKDTDATSCPNLDEILPVDGAPPAYTGAGRAIDSAVTKSMAYYRYFTWYIDPTAVRQNKELKTGIKAFYERYPLLAHAVRTITANYQANIKLACQRVARDWKDIQAAFFPGLAIEKLAKIRTTGNDFHKGGKQVLILTFLCSDGTLGRVVYKPSAVEIDCRIVGDSAIVNAISPDGYQQRASLAELINPYNPPRTRPGGFTSRPLPTYRILPYNRDSVPDAYGYIEFLAHEPSVEVHATDADGIRAEVGAKVAALDPAALKRSDWITEEPRDGQVFYHVFGGLMAMAMAVSLCDLHPQNIITHDRLPHLIDLEEALKHPMPKAEDTYLTTVIDQVARAGSGELEIQHERTSDLSLWNWKFPNEPAASLLYVRAGSHTRPEPALARDEPNRRALIHGFIDVIEALTIPACHEEVKAWVGSLERTIARFVTRSTREYARAGRDMYQTYPENSPRALLNDSGYDAFKTKDATGQDQFFFTGRVRGMRQIWNSNQEDAAADQAPWILPLFAVEHPDHAWRDYLNGDVPSFYHRLGSLDLLNTKGDIVDVADVIEWQDLTFHQQAGDLNEFCGRPLSDGVFEKTVEIHHYFPERPIDMALAQLNRMMADCATSQGKRKFLQASLAGAGGTGRQVSEALWSRWAQARGAPRAAAPA